MKRWVSHVNRLLSSTQKYLKGLASTNVSRSSPAQKINLRIFLQRIKQNARRFSFGQIFYSEAFFVRAVGFFLGAGISSATTSAGFVLAPTDLVLVAVLETLFARGVIGSSAIISAGSSTSAGNC